MPTSHYVDLINKISGHKLLIVGDLYLDEYVWGNMAEISHEGPFPVIHIHHRIYHPGAAGSVAAQVQTLGSRAFVIGIIGRDTDAKILRKEFRRFGVALDGLVVDKEKPTNNYTKIRAGAFPLPSQELFRLDTPPPLPPSDTIEKNLIEKVRSLAPHVEGIIVEDQAGGVVTPAVLETVYDVSKKHNLFLTGDSRMKPQIFRGFDLVVPNRQEASLATGLSLDDDSILLKALEILVRRHRHKTAAITMSSKGMIARERGGKTAHMPTSRRNVLDVTAAGDTVTAALTLGLMSGIPLKDSVALASYAAGIAVEKIGTYSVTTADLRTRLEVETIGKAGKKIVPASKLPKIVREHQARGDKVVWTNGCFDIIHLGHIFYLENAKKEGDILIVGLNSDASIIKVKGPRRPIISEKERAQVLAALECVDYITIFEEPTPLNLLKKIKPQKYIKGGDYTLDTINQDERHLMERLGIDIVLMPKIEGASTTDVISKIRNQR